MPGPDERLIRWELQIAEIDERLRPIASRPVDITRPGWFQHLQKSSPPLDEAGLRERTEAVLLEIIAAYAQGPDSLRAELRDVFERHRSFLWAATLSHRPTCADGFRQHLVLFSIKDQGRDGRDALLTLGEIAAAATAAGVNIEPIVKEVAAISSSINRLGMGSTRQMLLNLIGGRP